MQLGFFTLMFCATRPLLFLMYKLSNTRNTSAFDSKSNFLRIGLSRHCLWDKARFAPPKFFYEQNSLWMRLAPPYPTAIYMEFKSRVLRANKMAKKKKKCS